MTLLNSITVFVLAVFIGFEIISKVPTMLHTPLMSGTNAIHGIVLVGAMLIAGSADSDLEKALAFVAVRQTSTSSEPVQFEISKHV